MTGRPALPSILLPLLLLFSALDLASSDIPPSPVPGGPVPDPALPAPSPALPTPLPAPAMGPSAPSSAFSPGNPESPPAPPVAPASSPTPSHANEVIRDGEKSDEQAEVGESSSGMSGGKKVGIAAGVLAATAVVGLGALLYKKRRENIERSRYGYATRSEML